MAKPKKTPTKKTPIRGIRSVADDCNEWKEYLIFGEYYPRVRHSGEEPCEGCHASRGEIHKYLGCKFEICPYCLDVNINCSCSAHRTPDIECQV